MAGDDGKRALTTEEMLAEEADAILGAESNRAGSLPEILKGLAEQKQRIRINADDRSGADVDAGTVEIRCKFYRSLNKLNRAALCLSGGGIRSATFCLGVIQALAKYNVNTSPPLPRPSAVPGTPPKLALQVVSSETVFATELEPRKRAPEAALPVLEKRRPEKLDITNTLLGRLHYLSTVSGGGYIGSWLSSWRTRNDFKTILDNLTTRPGGPDVEPPEISWLRAYSNYLTPLTGIASADTWAAVAIIVRNLVLNWLVIIPLVCLALLILKIIATIGVWIARGDDPVWAAYVTTNHLLYAVLGLGIFCLVVAQGFTTRHRPPRRPEAPNGHSSNQPGNVTENRFLFGDLIWAVASAIAVTIFFSSVFAVGLIGPADKMQVIGLTAVAGLAIYAVGSLCGFRRLDWIDFIPWALSGLVYGGLVGLGAYLYSLLGPYSCACTESAKLWALLVPVIFGVPWMLMAQLTADNIFGGLVSYEPVSDSDREWLGRAAGWISAVAIAWAIVALLVFAGGYLVETGKDWAEQLILALGGVSGIVAALLGSSSKTAATSSSGDERDYVAFACQIGLAVAGPIFAAVLVIALSIALDKVLLGASLVEILQRGTLPKYSILGWLFLGLFVLNIVAAVASRYVNINRFSLHALYRNRLIRAYLGASRQDRHPDLFTGFDSGDNKRMHELWPPNTGPRRLFHVVNIALNVVSTKRLAWQERKAESFTVSPKHSGSGYLGFRNSKDYGDSIHTAKGQGITLGTAMAISGAAVSSNMGYHSSTSLGLLLTLFNVRLGWWLGNPGPAGERHNAYQREGPRMAARPLFSEAFGLTTDESPYVYLSDGGHFENLGLYEMVRRRCRFIIVVDAGCDPDFAFEDLGNAARKIYIDLGVRIRFEGLEKLRNRPTKDDPPPEMIPYYAIGSIDYENADGSEPGCENGYVLYIKPAYHGIEGAAIRSYATANKTFPHEDTADQWFTESQFESYRALGMDIANNILGQEVVLNPEAVFRGEPPVTLHQVLQALPAVL